MRIIDRERPRNGKVVGSSATGEHYTVKWSNHIHSQVKVEDCDLAKKRVKIVDLSGNKRYILVMP